MGIVSAQVNSIVFPICLARRWGAAIGAADAAGEDRCKQIAAAAASRTGSSIGHDRSKRARLAEGGPAERAPTGRAGGLPMRAKAEGVHCCLSSELIHLNSARAGRRRRTIRLGGRLGQHA